MNPTQTAKKRTISISQSENPFTDINLRCSLISSIRREGKIHTTLLEYTQAAFDQDYLWEGEISHGKSGQHESLDRGGASVALSLHM